MRMRLTRMDARTHHSDVGVLGGGIMGCCLALELARRGRRVTLVDRAPMPMMKASLHNEGKLHLGFVYGKDPHKATHGLLARGSLAFARILESLTAQPLETLRPSAPFHYYVPADSQLQVDAVHRHFDDVEQMLRETCRATGDTYLGAAPDRWFERNAASEHARLFSPAATQGSFRTVEQSVSPVAVATLLRDAVGRHPNIAFAGATEVLAVTEVSSGCLRVDTRRDGAIASATYASVANCLWDDRMRIDRTFGMHDPGPWFLRYKAAISLTASGPMRREIPSSTGILGPYGDIVSHGNGAYYVSWYPRCKLAETTEPDGRALPELVHVWPVRPIRRVVSRFPALTQRLTAHTHRPFVRANLKELAAYVPPLADLLRAVTHFDVGGGVIVARGSSDIHDPQSHLHQRFRIGPVMSGSYVSIDTGKYCTAPLFAVEAADLISGVL